MGVNESSVRSAPSRTNAFIERASYEELLDACQRLRKNSSPSFKASVLLMYESALKAKELEMSMQSNPILAKQVMEETRQCMHNAMRD